MYKQAGDTANNKTQERVRNVVTTLLDPAASEATSPCPVIAAMTSTCGSQNLQERRKRKVALENFILSREWELISIFMVLLRETIG